MIIGVVCALAAAVAFAGCSVLQHRAARVERARDARLLLRLLTRPLWWAGGVLNGVGVGLQAIALGLLPVLVVAPLRLAGLPLALPLSALADRRRIRGGDLLAALLCAGGGAGFLVAAGSNPGRPALRLTSALVLLAAAAVIDGIGLLAARLPGCRFIALGAVGGLLNGLNALQLKTLAHAIGTRDGSIVAWSLPLLVVVGVLALLRTQQALQAPGIGAPLAAMTIAEPIAAALAGVLLLGEQLAGGAGAHAAQAGFALLGLVGAALLRFREQPPPAPGGLSR